MTIIRQTLYHLLGLFEQLDQNPNFLKSKSNFLTRMKIRKFILMFTFQMATSWEIDSYVSYLSHFPPCSHRKPFKEERYDRKKREPRSNGLYSAFKVWMKLFIPNRSHYIFSVTSWFHLGVCDKCTSLPLIAANLNSTNDVSAKREQ